VRVARQDSRGITGERSAADDGWNLRETLGKNSLPAEPAFCFLHPPNPIKTVFTLAIAWLVASARLVSAETTAETWSYTGTDIYPSAIISTATVDWHADEEEEEDSHKKKKTDEADVVPILGDKNG